jgi:hypothetical protein
MRLGASLAVWPESGASLMLASATATTNSNTTLADKSAPSERPNEWRLSCGAELEHSQMKS